MSELRVLLVGLPGSGKSAVGRALSERTGWPYLDNDELLRLVSDRGYEAEVAEGGLEVQERLDSEALTEAVTAAPPVVAEVPPGVIESTYDRARLEEGGFVVWVHAPAEVAAQRLAGRDHTPSWVGEDPEATLQELVEERDRLYAIVADLVLEVGELAPAQAAEQILATLRERDLFSVS